MAPIRDLGARVASVRACDVRKQASHRWCCLCTLLARTDEMAQWALMRGTSVHASDVPGQFSCEMLVQVIWFAIGITHVVRPQSICTSLPA